MSDPDKAPEPKPDDPFTPIVESLLKYDIDSEEFRDAAEVAGPAELTEAMRQIGQKRELYLEARVEKLERMLELERQHPGLADEVEEGDEDDPA
jgi:hypothetical protein